MRILMKMGGPSAGLAVSAFILALSLGCSGGGDVPPSVAPTVASAPESAPPAPPSAPPSGASLPLVDSRGEPAQAPAGGESMAGAELTWTVPGGWATETPSSGMRRAQYAIPAAAGDAEGGQCAVFYFGPGQGGDIQSNVDRWATQFTSAGGHPTPAITEMSVAGSNRHRNDGWSRGP